MEKSLTPTCSTPIPIGCCRSTISQHSERKNQNVRGRQPRRADNNSKINLESPYALIRTARNDSINHQLSSSPYSASSESQWVLCRIIGSISSNVNDEDDDDNLVSSVLLCYSYATTIVGNFDDWKTSGVVSAVHAGKNVEFTSQHQALRIPDHGHIRITLSKEIDILSSDHMNTALFVTLRCFPSPAMSITLEYDFCRDRNGSIIDTNLNEQPLLMSCLKRQLFGIPLLYQRKLNDNAVTGVTSAIQLTGEGIEWKFVLKSSVCIPKSPISGTRSSLFPDVETLLILPSTRITLLPLNPEGSGHIASEETNDDNRGYVQPDSTPSDYSSQVLMDTISCLHQARLSSNFLGTNIPRAFLLSGPAGVGKTHTVRVAVRKYSSMCHLTVLQGSEILSVGHPAEAAQELRRKFEYAISHGQSGDYKSSISRTHRAFIPLIFLDEMDALLSVDPLVSMLGLLLDRMAADKNWRWLILVGATNRISSIPGCLRRPGRLDKEIPLTPPNYETRFRILKSLLREKNSTNTKSSNELPEQIISDNQLLDIAQSCIGYVPADLCALVRQSKLLEMNKCVLPNGITRFDETCSRLNYLNQAMSLVGASALRDVSLSSPPKITWDDVAGDPGGAKTALRQATEWPRTRSSAYKALQLHAPRGILLHGPPGCAKTTLARAAAGASGVAFLSLAPSDVYSSSYVGEAEAVIRRSFTLARSAAPCILFFDEIDSIIGTGDGRVKNNHGMSRGTSSSAEARVLSTFLNEMDGIDGSWNDGVLVLGATNRPWTVDAALLRPGRFDKIIYVPPPDYDGRRDILAMQCQRWNVVSEIDTDLLAREEFTGSMTGAEIIGACQDAAMMAFRDAIERNKKPHLKEEYLLIAISKVHALLSNESVMNVYRAFEDSRRHVNG